MSETSVEPRCACGCGEEAPKSWDPKTGQRRRYIRQHYRRKPTYPTSLAERAAILRELAAGLDWTESHMGVTYSVGPESDRIKNMLSMAMRAVKLSPTLRKVLSREFASALKTHHEAC